MVVGGARTHSPLVGREDVSHFLHAAIVAVSTGNGDCVVIEGPAGIGKSRMLSEAAAQAGGLGLTVAEGRATELDRIAPFSTLLTALSVCAPPVLGKDDLASLRDHADSRFWLIDRLGGILETYSHARPDQHVAWRGDAPPPDWPAVIDHVRGSDQTPAATG